MPNSGHLEEETAVSQNKAAGRKRRLAALLLALLTVAVLAATFLFSSSLLVWWQPEATEVARERATTAVALDVAPAQSEATANAPAVAVAATFTATPPQTATPLPAVATPVATPPVEPTTEAETAVQFGNLIIPSLEINQPIVPVLVRDGQWDISQLDAQIGHLQTTGEYPGDAFAMTFTGHVTLPWPGVGPFADLILLKRGEEVIYRWQGTDYIYEVERIFRANPAAVELLYEPDGSKLILVTCSGWDFTDRFYAERLVTRAVLVREEPSPTHLQQ